ncbi:DUF6461 domain-containing protein [Planobispora longispora]|uniref:Uncharacterized protein n=1 Tax=Planobispora longispora TaxID=28887 RepID=A0A8J3RK69_9ACTN|nr:DUF6461 domain-containing protein [Planobispora longispora]BFE81801.1 hypothetical protein GCM10020093_044020 [Planobispora longispora]GIH76439.1 hypothetical protein Plo01_28680 [Planobispora longispora]
MTECPEEFRWLSGCEDLDEIYCVSFVRDLTPDEVLRRFSVDVSTADECDPADYVGTAKIGDWTLTVEPGGWQLAADPETYTRVGRGTEIVSVSRHDYASDTFAYIVDGEPVVWFDPMFPEERSGTDPDRFVGEMREVGLDPDHDIDDSEDIRFPIERSFALASRITGLRFSPEMLELCSYRIESGED